MKILRWAWPLLLVALLFLIPGGCWVARPTRTLDLVVVDKTVPYRNRIEHRSLFWLLRHLKIRRPEGGRYVTDRDYLGAFPGPTPGDPPEHTTELTSERAMRADLVYLADTYGVYHDDLLSGEPMKAALERSPRIYGGCEPAEAEAAAAAVRAGKTLIAEFNTLGSPTSGEARATLEATLGVHWTRWIGRFFAHLDDTSEVPQWMRRDYEREWKKPWEFTGPGYVLMQDDAHCEVLQSNKQVEPIGLTLHKEDAAGALLADARNEISYPYWFDIVGIEKDTTMLASFRWHVTPAGYVRLQARALPVTFAAVTRRSVPGRGPAYYFAGDFADNPLRDAPIPLAGYPVLRNWLEGTKLYPSEDSFYWCFYAPMMTKLLEGVPSTGKVRP
jgi:hypothetical protein